MTFSSTLLDMSTQWQKSKTEGVYEGVDRKTKAVKWTTNPSVVFRISF
ncbi:MAG: hypothetical protein R2877_03030 [Bdellovibrionota bacterium]